MKTLLLLLCFSLLPACGPPDIRIKRLITEDEVVGTWQLDPDSSALVVDGDSNDCLIDSSKTHEIIFRSDGTCRYRSVLQMPTRYAEAEGTWRIVPTPEDPKGSQIELHLNLNGTYLFALDVKEDSEQLILWEFWSDPDLWNFLEYKKIKN